MVKPRLTLDEHIAVGYSLAVMRDELVHLNVQVANAYPHAGREGRAARRLDAALRALDDARCFLDDAVFREHGDSADTTIYYPHQEDRRTHAV